MKTTMNECPGSLTEAYRRNHFGLWECNYCRMMFRRIEMKGPPNASDLVLPNHGDLMTLAEQAVEASRKTAQEDVHTWADRLANEAMELE